MNSHIVQPGLDLFSDRRCNTSPAVDNPSLVEAPACDVIDLSDVPEQNNKPFNRFASMHLHFDSPIKHTDWGNWHCVELSYAPATDIWTVEFFRYWVTQPAVRPMLRPFDPSRLNTFISSTQQKQERQHLFITSNLCPDNSSVEEIRWKLQRCDAVRDIRLPRWAKLWRSGTYRARFGCLNGYTGGDWGYTAGIIYAPYIPLNHIMVDFTAGPAQ